MKFYITTPVYYVNDKPHIGSAYTTIVADVLARFRRGAFLPGGGEDVVFLTGVDENSQKTVDAAAKSGEEIHAYTDRLAGVWQSAWQKLGISNTDFIRTTEERHIATVNDFWSRLDSAGDLYRDRYDGLYCRGHEAFMKEDELTPDGLCPEHKTKPELVSEENYFFRLSKYQNQLLEFYNAHGAFVAPANRFNEVRAFVEAGLEDISFSRERKEGRAAWGIPVPREPNQAIYVWADALVNYVSALGIEGWEEHPADIHAVGKDIVRFHAVIWPAMLMSAGLPLPGQVIVNGFLTVDGTKISKSLGNAIDPLDLVARYGGEACGADAVRYFLLREVPYGADGDFSEEKMKERYNGDLANGLGNFAARVLALASKEMVGAGGESSDDKNTNGENSAAGTLKISKLEVDFQETITEMNRKVIKKINEVKFHEALAAIWSAISFGDRYVNDKKVWEIENDSERTAALYNLVSLLEAVAAALAPFMPETTKRIGGAIEREDGVIRARTIKPLFPRIK